MESQCTHWVEINPVNNLHGACSCCAHVHSSSSSSVLFILPNLVYCFSQFLVPIHHFHPPFLQQQQKTMLGHTKAAVVTWSSNFNDRTVELLRLEKYTHKSCLFVVTCWQQRDLVNSMMSSISPALSQRNRLVWECFFAQIRPHDTRCWASFECKSSKAVTDQQPFATWLPPAHDYTTTTFYNVKMTMSVCSTRPAQSLGLYPIKHLWDEIE